MFCRLYEIMVSECVCVCMYVIMYVCSHLCTYVCMYVCMYVHTYVCMYVCSKTMLMFFVESKWNDVISSVGLPSLFI
jgi:hypothetical protein